MRSKDTTRHCIQAAVMLPGHGEQVCVCYFSYVSRASERGAMLPQALLVLRKCTCTSILREELFCSCRSAPPLNCDTLNKKRRKIKKAYVNLQWQKKWQVNRQIAWERWLLQKFVRYVILHQRRMPDCIIIMAQFVAWAAKPFSDDSVEEKIICEMLNAKV